MVESQECADGVGGPSRWGLWLARLDALGISRGVLGLCLVWLVAFGPVVQPLFHAGAPRMALTDALASKGTVRIDDYVVGVDRVERDGHTYSDKAVGQEMLAIPVYLAARAVGAESASIRGSARTSPCGG